MVKGSGPSLLGRDWLQYIQLDWAQLNKVQTEHSSKLPELLNAHTTLLTPGLGKIESIKAKLCLKKNAKPKFLRACQVPLTIQGKVEKENDRQVAAGILELVKFSNWSTPVVPIMKKVGSIRLCGDYKITPSENNTYPLPHIEEMLSSVAGGTVFSTLDLAQAYQQVMLDEDSKKIVTITTHKGPY